MDDTKMTLSEFTEEIKFYLANEFGHAAEDIRFLPAGMTASEHSEEIIIRDTNLRYFNQDSNVLQGNFLVIGMLKPGQPLPDNVRDANTIERFFIDAMYQEYRKNGFDAALKRMQEGRTQRKLVQNSDTLSRVDNYDQVLERLIIRPLNYNNNRNILRNHVYRRVQDIALVLYLIIADENNNYMTAKCPKPAFEAWGKSEDQVFEDAMRNTQRLHPAKAYKINRGAGLADALKDLGPLETLDDIQGIRYMSLTGENNPNGAISLFFPGVMALLREKIGMDYYVVFTSIEEAAIHAVDNNEPRSLLRSLKSVNKQFNTPSQVLSTHVFQCDGKELKQLNL